MIGSYKENIKTAIIIIIGWFILIILMAIFFCSYKYYEEYYTVSKLDLSKEKTIDNNIIISNIQYYNKINVVDIGDNDITRDDVEKIHEVYPDVTIKGNIINNISGINFDETVDVMDLSRVIADNSLIDNIKYFSNLKEVYINKYSFTDEDLMNLVNNYDNINFHYSVDIAGIKIDSLVESVDLSNTNIENLDDLYASIEKLKKVNYIDFSDCNLDNETLAKIRDDFPNIKIVWMIHLNKTFSLKTDTKSFSVLITNFPYLMITSKDLEKLKYCTDLEALDLGHQAITDITAIGEYLPNLRVLILADNDITDITPLKNLKHLHYLELFLNNITDITPLENLDELVDLNLSNNYYLKNIEPIKNLPLLERLWITKTAISMEDINILKSIYPSVKIVYEGAGSTDSGWRTHSRYYAMIDMFKKRNYISDEFTKYDK